VEIRVHVYLNVNYVIFYILCCSLKHHAFLYFGEWRHFW